MNTKRFPSKARRIAVAMAMTLGTVATIHGDLINANRKFTPAGGAAGDNFGESIAINGDSIIAGASSHNSGRGAAYVYAIVGPNIAQQAELAASGGVAGDNFGCAVAVAPGRAIVGADQSLTNRGTATVFVQSGTNWTQQALLSPVSTISGDQFGASVAMDSITAIVGAPGTLLGMGSVYLYTRVGSSWIMSWAFANTNGLPLDRFGSSVALDGTILAIGASGAGATRGAVYVYERQLVVWVLQAKLTATDAAIGDFFGTSVAVNDGRVIVGASGKDSRKGAAYIFSRYGTNWLQTARLNSLDRQNDAYFGSTVAIDGGLALVGSSGADSGRGSAQLFARFGTNWIQRTRIRAADGIAGNRFGYSVSMHGSRAVAGAPSNTTVGAGYLFNTCQHATLAAEDGVAGDFFGQSISADRNSVLVGVPASATNRGAAYLFGKRGNVWPQLAKITDTNGLPGDQFGSSVAIEEDAMIVGAPGAATNRGSIGVFAKIGTNVVQQATIASPTDRAGDRFGNAVAVDTAEVLVGAVGTATNSGAAWMIARSTITNVPALTMLTASDGAINKRFGCSVSKHGDLAAVGAYGDNGNRGAVYVFARQGTNWTQTAKLIVTNAAGGDNVGISVAIRGRTIIAGANQSGIGAGAAFVFALQGTNWVQTAKLAAYDGSLADQFGSSVSFDSFSAIIGAPGHNGGAGAIYRFTRAGEGTNWIQHTKIGPPGIAAGAAFGSAVSIDGGTIAASAPGVNANTGSAYVFECTARAHRDFDWDGRLDFVNYYQPQGIWYVLGDSLGYSAPVYYGWIMAVPAPGDYDGDGRTDFGTYVPDSGEWNAFGSSTGPIGPLFFGSRTAQNVQSDYDGDGKTDIALFVPASGTWYVIRSRDGKIVTSNWGYYLSKAVPADYDGDGKTDIGVFDPPSGTWYILRSADGRLLQVTWGNATFKPVPADYDGDGKDDIAVFDPASGNWHILRSSDGGYTLRNWGYSASITVPGDYDADGKADIAVFDPASGTWYILRSSDGVMRTQNWGSASIPPVAATP